jgi:hypothetical protein
MRAWLVVAGAVALALSPLVANAATRKPKAAPVALAATASITGLCYVVAVAPDATELARSVGARWTVVDVVPLTAAQVKRWAREQSDGKAMCSKVGVPMEFGKKYMSRA